MAALQIVQPEATLTSRSAGIPDRSPRRLSWAEKRDRQQRRRDPNNAARVDRPLKIANGHGQGQGPRQQIVSVPTYPEHTRTVASPHGRYRLLEGGGGEE